MATSVSSVSIADLSAKVDGELEAIIGARDFPLYRMMAYHLGWSDAAGQPEAYALRGERVHGVLTLLACAAVGGDTDACLPAAAAVELVDKFTQIHDDVQEGSPQRDARDAVWWVWGPAQAINAGDGMHALGRLALFRLLERGVAADRVFRAVQLVDEASLQTCEGRFRDLEAQERIDLSVDAYMRMAGDKTGALPACAMRLGALLGGGDADAADALGRSGARLGVAMQVRSDLNQIWGGSDLSQPSVEVMNKKKLLPVVYALEKASVSEKRAMGEIYFKRVLEADDAARLRGVIEGLGARKACEDMVSRLTAEATAELDCAGVSSDGKAQIAGYIRALTE